MLQWTCVFQLIDEDYDIKNGVGAQPIEIKQGRIDIDHVSFQYNDMLQF
ncbi:hypothetical protein ACVPOS_15270 [Staphylococcus aureus]